MPFISTARLVRTTKTKTRIHGRHFTRDRGCSKDTTSQARVQCLQTWRCTHAARFVTASAKRERTRSPTRLRTRARCVVEAPRRRNARFAFAEGRQHEQPNNKRPRAFGVLFPTISRLLAPRRYDRSNDRRHHDPTTPRESTPVSCNSSRPKRYATAALCPLPKICNEKALFATSSKN